jgi:hypothetical protein
MSHYFFLQPSPAQPNPVDTPRAHLPAEPARSCAGFPKQLQNELKKGETSFKI